jgi:hypothetical protein
MLSTKWVTPDTILNTLLINNLLVNVNKCDETQFICVLNVLTVLKNKNKKDLLRLWELSVFGFSLKS